MVSLKSTGPRFNIKMSSYQYRKSHCGDKTVVRSSYLHNGISYTGKITSLYWIRAQNNKLNVFQIILLRQIIRNRKISNSEIYKLCSIEPWSNEIKRQRLKWFGNFVRLPENAPAKQALAEARKPYKRISGGQPTNWLSTIKEDFSETNYTLKEAFEIMTETYTPN